MINNDGKRDKSVLWLNIKIASGSKSLPIQYFI